MHTWHLNANTALLTFSSKNNLWNLSAQTEAPEPSINIRNSGSSMYKTERLGVTWTPCKQTDSESGYGWVVKVENFQDGVLLPQPPDLKQKPGSLKQKPCLLLSPTSCVLSHSHPRPSHPHWQTNSGSSRMDQHTLPTAASQSIFPSSNWPTLN